MMHAVQRLALFDLDNTLVDLDEAFQVWAAEFVDEHALERDAVAWMIALDRAGSPHRAVFFTKVRDHFAFAESADELWGRYRKRMPYLVRCRPEVMEGLARPRAASRVRLDGGHRY